MPATFQFYEDKEFKKPILTPNHYLTIKEFASLINATITNQKGQPLPIESLIRKIIKVTLNAKLYYYKGKYNRPTMLLSPALTGYLIKSILEISNCAIGSLNNEHRTTISQGNYRVYYYTQTSQLKGHPIFYFIMNSDSTNNELFFSHNYRDSLRETLWNYRAYQLRISKNSYGLVKNIIFEYHNEIMDFTIYQRINNCIIHEIKNDNLRHCVQFKFSFPKSDMLHEINISTLNNNRIQVHELQERNNKKWKKIF